MQTTNFSLDEILRRAQAKNIKIPQFQRRLVWKESQVKLLIDSMSRSYPIGSLLILDRTPDLGLASRSIEAEIRVGDNSTVESGELDENMDDVESYILDGQQRATSIARVFLNAHPRKLYYFDLKLMLEEHPLEEISWIKVRQRGKKTPDRKDKNRLLRADIALDQPKADVYISEYVEDSKDFPDFENDRTAARQAAARIKGIFETIRNYKIPVVSIERNSGVESICRVFETINSTGTKLTTFDLAVARFYPKPDLRGFWERTLENHSVLENFEVDGEQVLQVVYLSLAARSGKYPDPTRGKLLALTREEINSEWDKSSAALAEAYGWARAQGARQKTLPNRNVLVAMAAIGNLYSKENKKWKDDDFIRRWYFSKVMQQGASQASNYRIGQDFMALRQYMDSGKPLSVQEVNLNTETLLKLKPSDVRYKALQNIFATTINLDMLTGNAINSEDTLHDHHIYPRNASKQYDLLPDMLDSICNRVPILGESNQSLGEGYPKEYFGQLMNRARKQGTLDGLCLRMRNCMIPGDPRNPGWHETFSVHRFEEFCRQRAALIMTRIRGIVGDSLRARSPDDDEAPDYDE